MNNFSELTADLSPEQRKLLLLPLRKLGEEKAGSAPAPIRPQKRETPAFPMSFAQQRLWFLDQLAPGNPFYNIPAAVRLAGRLDLAPLARSLKEIVRRHESLRTTFTVARDQAVQVIAPAISPPISFIDLRALPEAAREAETRQLAIWEAQQPFDLLHGPLLRITLLWLSEQDYIVLLSLHHIVCDGWSIGILLRELGALYTAFTAGRPSSLPDLPIQYADFVVWQRQWMQGDVLARQLAYWRSKLAGAPPLLDLSAERKWSPAPADQGATHAVAIAPSLLKGLKALGQEENATLFMTLLAAFQALLHVYSQQEDILVGTPVAGRSNAETEELIGFFVNTLVLRTDLSGNPSFREALRRVRANCLESYANQDLPFEKLVEVLQPARSLGQTPLFQAWFVLQQEPLPLIELPGLSVDLLEIDSGVARYDLRLGLQEQAEGLVGTLGYRSEQFAAEMIADMVRRFEQLLSSAIAQPNTPLATIAAAIVEARTSCKSRAANLQRCRETTHLERG